MHSQTLHTATSQQPDPDALTLCNASFCNHRDKYIHCRKAGLLKPFHTKRGPHRLHASTVQMYLVDTHIVKEYSGSRRQVSLCGCPVLTLA